MTELEIATLDGGSVGLDRGDVSRLADGLAGEVLLPQDEGYDEARSIWNAMIDKRPALVARCAAARDVVATVNFAREHELLVAVRGGGHNVAGKAICDGGLLIDLSMMKAIKVDSEGQRVRAQAGLKLGELDEGTQAHGLATPLGIATDTGISGLTLGGGYGWLGGKYGMTCDNLISAEVVTTDGGLLTVSAEENEDLFWGIRGGGANFGVVTSFEYRSYPLTQVYGGLVIHPMDKAREALRVYHEFASNSPDEVSFVPALLAGPEGSPVVGAVICCCGSFDEAEQALAPLGKFSPPLDIQLGVRPYVQMQSLLDDFVPPGRLYYWKSSLLRSLSDDAIEVLVEQASTMPATPGTMVYLQQLHGAATRVSPTETAFPHRFDHFNCGAMAGWDDPAESEKNIRWSRQTWEALQPFFEEGAYVNDLGDEGEDRVRAAYGPNYERLVALKTQYDPDNFFRLNQNIRPTADAG